MGAIGEYKGAPVVRNGAGSNSVNNTKQVIVVHDTEGGYEGAISWMVSQQNGSYQILRALGGHGTRLVPDNRQAWGAGPKGNQIGLHICLEGYARFSRAEWLSKGKNGLEGMARDIAAWSKQYNIPLVRITPAQVRAGQRGICTHHDISLAFGQSDHTDPGPGFPLDLVIARAREINGLAEGAPVALPADKDIKAQLTGSPDPGKYPGWKQLGDRTLVDAVAAIGAALKIDGFSDPAKK